VGRVVVARAGMAGKCGLHGTQPRVRGAVLQVGGEKLTAIITSHPPRDWSGHELAVLLGVKPRNMLTQLGEWARLGFFTRTGFGTYKLNTPPAQTPSTNPPDP
jgi:hypothetical protein